MDSTLTFIAIIAIVILIVVFACQNNNSTAPSITEKFTTCPENKYRPRPLKYPDYGVEEEKEYGIKYGQDEDINYHIVNPLVPRKTKFPREKSNWKTFWKGKFMPGNVKDDTNFEGTQVRNYLDSIRYFNN